MPLPAQSIQGGTALMPEDRPLWAYYIHPWNLVRHKDEKGEPYYLPFMSVCVYEHGVRSVKNDGKVLQVTQADSAMMAKGFIAVPMDMEIEAHGKKRRGYLGDINGQPLKSRGQLGVYWPSAWERFEMVHDRIVRRPIDQEGFMKFRRACLQLLGPLSQEQLDAAQVAPEK